MSQAQRAVIALFGCLVVWMAWQDRQSSQYPSPTQTQSAEHRSNESGLNKQLVLWGWLTRDAVGFFTLCLAAVGVGQLVLFFVQLKLIRKSLEDTKLAAEAAKKSADAAVISAEHMPRVERAYLFLAMDFVSSIKEFEHSDPTTRSRITFGLKNHGKTPAVMEELHTMAKYWGASWPAMGTAEKILIQKGWMISAGETQSGYEIAFALRADEIDRAKEGKGYILFWGKAVYRDVFKNTHESGWCRAFHFESNGWLFAGDETLNYYT
jgi:hypothetical protein